MHTLLAGLPRRQLQDSHDCQHLPRTSQLCRDCQHPQICPRGEEGQEPGTTDFLSLPQDNRKTMHCGVRHTSGSYNTQMAKSTARGDMTAPLVDICCTSDPCNIHWWQCFNLQFVYLDTRHLQLHPSDALCTSRHMRAIALHDSATRVASTQLHACMIASHQLCNCGPTQPHRNR